MATTSIITCSIDAAKFARVCANYQSLFAERSVEVVGIHDARSLAEGYNRGVARAHGDIVILSHDDIEILSPDFALRVAEALAHFDLIGIVGTTRVVAGKWSGAGDPFVYTLISSPDPERGGYGTALLGGAPLVVPGIHLPATWNAKEGARASFAAKSKEEIMRRCTPDQLTRIALQIGRANASL